MKAWHEVIVPHADIRKGQFDESVFAADLSDVVAGRGPLEYRDASTFFAKTYPTAGLQQVLLAVLGRLTGTHPCEGVIQIQTPFGGGKTHSLIALYHAVRTPQATERLKGEVSPELAHTLDALRQMSSAPRVAVFVGTAADALSPTTPWGEMAKQIDRYDRIQAHDASWTPPGKDNLHQLLGDEPTLILMDELAEYLVKLSEKQAPQMLAFLQELTETVKVIPHTALVATLPSSAPYGEAGERALNQLQRIFGRVESIYTPVEEQEVYEVIRRRLFENLPDRVQVSRTAEAYWQTYRRLGEDVPPEAREPEYRERMERAYPFHPELIDLLVKRWSTIPTFQRTRGALRLLAEVVADLYANRHSAPLIQPSHLNLANQRIRRELLKHIDNRYDGVITSDIAGKDARAVQIDESLESEVARWRPTTGLATAIFFASFSGGERQGVSLPHLRLAMLTPDIEPAVVGDTLKRLETELWYLHSENGLYRFLIDPNLNRIIYERMESLSRDELLDAIRALLEQYHGSEMEVTLFPQQSQDVPDTPHLRLAILSPDQTRRASGTEAFVSDLLERHGSAYRTYRNVLVALVADDQEIEQLHSTVRNLVALRHIEDDRQVMTRLSEENRSSLQSKLHEAKQGMLHWLLCAYRHLAKASTSGVQWLDMGTPTPSRHSGISARVLQYLKGEETLVERLAPRQILEKALVREEAEKPVAEIVEVYLRYPSYPMLASKSVVWNSVDRGVQEGLFALRIGEEVIARRAVSLEEVQDAVLVREVPPPEAVREASLLTAPPTPTATTLPTVGIETPSQSAVRRRYHLRLRVPIDRFSDILRGVVNPLREQSDNLQVEWSIDAIAGEGGFNEAKLKQTVHETLSQLGIEPEEEEYLE